MALFPRPANSWMQSTGFPSQVFGTETYGSDDYELYEEDGEFVLTIDMPGFDREEIDLAWDDGVLNVAAEHVDDERGRRKTYHRRFRFPKDVDEDAITARYSSVLKSLLTDGRNVPVRSVSSVPNATIRERRPRGDPAGPRADGRPRQGHPHRGLSRR